VTDLLRFISALAALSAVIVFLAAIISPTCADRYERFALRLGDSLGAFRLGEPPVFFEGNDDGGAGDGGIGDGGDGGSGDGGSGDGGDGGSTLEADARAAIDALKAAGAEIPAALQRAVDEFSKARKEAGKYRTERNGTAAELTTLKSQMAALHKHFGLADDSDPAKIAEAATAERDKLAGENRQLKIDAAFSAAASKHKADPELTLAVLRSGGALDKLDPANDTFTADLESAVKEAVEKNPKLKATQAVRSGNDLGDNGNGNGDKPKSLADAISAHYS
jgi:hypothetical protein